MLQMARLSAGDLARFPSARAPNSPLTTIQRPAASDLNRFRLYNNIQVDGTGTKFYSSAALFAQAISAVIDILRASQTGLAVLDEIHAAFPHRVTIKPFEGKELNAFSTPTNDADAMPKGVFEAKGKKKIEGDGLGSDTNIAFTPGMYANAFTYRIELRPGVFEMGVPIGFKIVRPPGARPEDVLLHEMTHTSRQLAGLMDNTPLGQGYDNEEEFYAILVANIFASEKGRANDLRLNHHGSEPLVLDTDEKFLPYRDDGDFRYRTVGKFIRTQPRLTRKLALIPSAFNPIRRYNQLQFALPPNGISARLSLAHSTVARA